jgi:hypothetical protein
MGLIYVEHRYQTCRDEECQRYACRIYKEGFANGWASAQAVAEARSQ